MPLFYNIERVNGHIKIQIYMPSSYRRALRALKVGVLLLSYSISPMHLLPGGRKMGQFEGVSTIKMCPT